MARMSVTNRLPSPVFRIVSVISDVVSTGVLSNASDAADRPIAGSCWAAPEGPTLYTPSDVPA